MAGGTDSPSPPLCGRLTEHKGLPVLELWGDAEQAGYAHGYLLAEKIVRLFDGYVLDRKVTPNPAIYETLLLPAVRRQFVWSPAHERELRAIGRGMRDRLAPATPRSEVLDRELTVDDLLAANALADWFGMMCATVSAWGPLTVDGQTITARNLGFPSTGVMERAQLVVIRRGDGRMRPWIGVTWPSLIGVYTAMSDAGVTMLMHDAPGLSPSEALGFTPRSLILREALEQATPGNFIRDAQTTLQIRRVMVGNNIHVSGPLTAGHSPAAVFEYDANARGTGVTVRSAEKNGPPLTDALWCTNHQRLRRAPSECWRYDQLSARLADLTKEGRKLDPAAALKLIESVRQDITLHSVCCVPHKRIMYVHIPAISEKVVEFRLEEWLKRPIGGPDRTKQAPPERDQP